MVQDYLLLFKQEVLVDVVVVTLVDHKLKVDRKRELRDKEMMEELVLVLAQRRAVVIAI